MARGIIKGRGKVGRELMFMEHQQPIQPQSGKSGDCKNRILSSCSLAARWQACGPSQLTNTSAWDSYLEGEAPECRESPGLLTAAAWGECPVGQVCGFLSRTFCGGARLGLVQSGLCRRLSLDLQPSRRS